MFVQVFIVYPIRWKPLDPAEALAELLRLRALAQTQVSHPKSSFANPKEQLVRL